MKITDFNPNGIPVSLGGWSTGITSINSNTTTTDGGLSALYFVQRVTANGSNILLNPSVNIAAGSGISLAAASNTVTISSTGGGGGGGAALTVEEVDGAPTDAAITKIVFPNGTLGIASHIATYTPAGAALTVEETDASPTDSAVTKIKFPAGSIAIASHEVTYQPLVAIPIVIGDGATAMSTGSKGYIEIPFACTVISNRLAADVSGSVVVDIKKATYSGLFTTTSICSATKPTLSSARKSEDTTLTSWTTAIAAGDWLEFNVDSVTTIKRVTLSLTVRRA